MEFAEITYFTVTWVIGTAVGCFRAARDRDYDSCLHLFSVGALAGSVAFGVVAIGGFHTGNRWAGCGLAAVVGALGRNVIDTMLSDLGVALSSAGGAVTARVRQFFGQVKDDKPNDDEPAEPK